MKRRKHPRVEYSVYDLNMAQTIKVDLPYVLANEKVTNPRFEKEHFIREIWRSVEYYCERNNMDYEYLKDAPPAYPIIIDSNDPVYFNFLSVALTFYDPFLIPHFLTYQYNNFKGNNTAKDKLDFLGQIVFIVYETLKLNSPNQNLHRKEKIFDWLERNGAEDLPKRFSMRANPIDERLRGEMTTEEIRHYWMALKDFREKKGKAVVEVLNEEEILIFLQANFWGFQPHTEIKKLSPRNISQASFRKFCKSFFDKFSSSNRNRTFIQMLKANFSIFDNISESALAANFSR